MTIEKLKPGMTVYDVHKHTMGMTPVVSVGVWSVEIVSVNEARGTVIARWNHNPERVYSRKQWSKWRLKKPELVQDSFGACSIKKKNA